MARMTAAMAAVRVMEKEGVNQAFGVPGAAINPLYAALRQRGVTLAMMDGRIRACTHLDVNAGQIEETIGYVREIVRGA